MAITEQKIEVFKREERGRRDVRRLRATGFVPGIYYASDAASSVPFKVSMAELLTAIRGEALIYHVTVGGERRNVLMKEVQYHPVTDEILHVDLQGVRMDELVEVTVPITVVGIAIGVKDQGGQLHQEMLDVTISCRAGDIPPYFELDISEMNLGDSIHASELELGDATLVSSPESLVLAIAAPRAVIEEEEAEAADEFEFEEGEEKAEGEKSEESPDSDG